MTQMMEAPAALARTNGDTSQFALAPVEDNGEFQNLLDASRFGHLQRVATLFANSQLVPVHFQGNVANCFIAMQMAMRMRVDPFMFMQNTYIVYGRPGMEAKLAIALINSSGLFSDSLDYEIEGENPKAQNYRVRAFAKRKSTGKVVNGPWVDWELVKAEDWLSKKGSKWQTMPGLMFQYRAATFFGRLHCPERLMGMQTIDELRDTGELPHDRTVVSAGVASRTGSLAEKLTSRPVSEGQKLVADPFIAEAQDQQAENIDTSTGEVISESKTGEPAVMAEPPVMLGDQDFINAMNEMAMTKNVPEGVLTTCIKNSVGTRKREKLSPKERAEIWTAFRDGTGAFV